MLRRDTLEAGAAPAAHRLYLEGTTHPDFRGHGIGTAQLAWAIRRGTQAHEEGFPGVRAFLQCNAAEHNAEQTRLLSSAGFVPQRWQFGMCRDLALPVALAPAPDGLAVRPYVPAMAEATRQAHNDAFAEHWGFATWSPALWKQWVSDTRTFRPSVSRVLVEPDRPDVVIGYVVIYEYEADQAATGVREAYVGKVGVHRRWRGRGAASALLAESLRACRQAGFAQASLDVDADNPTGALGVYEKLGFRVERRWVQHVLTLD